ncbi:JAB domain-containing protein [Massilibacterium senegalense]|nr:JAB domain-containing protein [Massilibacterium senegalense]
MSTKYLSYFREAYKRSAASIICIHNHPSGVRLHM